MPYYLRPLLALVLAAFALLDAGCGKQGPPGPPGPPGASVPATATTTTAVASTPATTATSLPMPTIIAPGGTVIVAMPGSNVTVNIYPPGKKKGPWSQPPSKESTGPSKCSTGTTVVSTGTTTICTVPVDPDDLDPESCKKKPGWWKKKQPSWLADPTPPPKEGSLPQCDGKKGGPAKKKWKKGSKKKGPAATAESPVEEGADPDEEGAESDP